MAITPEVLEFEPPDLERVLSRVNQMASSHVGWVNLQPAVVEDELSRRGPGLLSLFGRRPPELTLATWIAGVETRRGFGPESVGIQHGRAQSVRRLLADDDVEIPGDWRVVQDAPRRGFVANLPEQPDRAAVIAWLIDATAIVSPVETTRRWRALIHWAEKPMEPRNRRRPVL